MAKVTGPLLSLGASGQIGGSQVYAKWKGIPYVRQKVIPANPRSAGQTQTRSVFSFLSGYWKLANAQIIAPWNAFAKGQPKSGRNIFMGTNIKLLREGTDLSALVASPGANGGVSVDAATASGGSGTITGAVTAPTLPTGWSVVAANMAAIKSADPHTSLVYQSLFATDVSSPYAPALTGVAAGTYDVQMWMEYTKADGSTAYSPSIQTTATVT